LEEIELYFHPELQRTYLKRLFDGIKQIDIPNIKSLNICFVTHSPFVLSDIPARNILALKKDIRDKEKISLSTFGANIHEMLRNSFFLKDGSIGDYASHVIEQIISSLQNIAYKKEIMNMDIELHNKIMLIDEPLIRDILLKEYHRAFPNISKEQRIAELRKQIEDLENRN
jgi:predicted ATP-binding protein involved in virulence